MVLSRRWLLTLAAFSFIALTAPAADTDEKPKAKLSREEQQVLDLTNAERAREKLPALKASEKLCMAARSHSANMAKQRKLAHELDGSSVPDRVKLTEYVFRTCGENVALTPRLSPATAMKSWMNSPGHKANILSDKYEEIGLGIGRDVRGACYYTQVFATEKK